MGGSELYFRHVPQTPNPGSAGRGGMEVTESENLNKIWIKVKYKKHYMNYFTSEIPPK